MQQSARCPTLLNNQEHAHFSTMRTAGPCGSPPPMRHHTFYSLGLPRNKTLWCLHHCKGLWTTSDWKRTGKGASLLTTGGVGWDLQGHTFMSPWEFPLPLQHFCPGYSSHKLDLWWSWYQTLQHSPATLCTGALPPWGDSRMSQMRTRPSSEELAKMLSFTGLTDKPYTASSWANTSKVSLLRDREQREADRHTHTHKNSAESQPSSS